jgi:hypothetical protein
MNELITSMVKTILELEEENAKLKERLEQYETVSKNVEPTTTNELTPHIEYHSNGNVWVKGQKNSKGQYDGIWKIFYENGNISMRIPHVGGKIDGIVELFYENGNIIKTQLWKEGKLIEETEN